MNKRCSLRLENKLVANSVPPKAVHSEWNTHGERRESVFLYYPQYPCQIWSRSISAQPLHALSAMTSIVNIQQPIPTHVFKLKGSLFFIFRHFNEISSNGCIESLNKQEKRFYLTNLQWALVCGDRTVHSVQHSW